MIGLIAGSHWQAQQCIETQRAKGETRKVQVIDDISIAQKQYEEVWLFGTLSTYAAAWAFLSAARQYSPKGLDLPVRFL